MGKLNDKKSENKNAKWDFEDYAFAVATVLFFALPIVGLVFVNHSIETLEENLLLAFDSNAVGIMNIHRWWPVSWMFFMFAWSACTIKDVIDIKRGVEGADNDLEDVAETALYISITTIMLLVGIIRVEFYSSWLAGPIVFVLLAVIWPILRNSEDKEKAYFPTIPFILLLAGIVVEIVIGGWIAFPVSWILISAVKLYKTMRKCKFTEDFIVDIAYHAFSIILLSTSLIWGSWIISWLAYPISVIIGKAMCRIKRKSA